MIGAASRPQPSFLVIGAMKSATTSLCDLLATHPRVCIAEPREPEFFCKDDLYARGWEWYADLLRPPGTQDIIGEGSTSYTKSHLFPRTADRIARDLPAVKLIYIVRHPLDRIVSHWMHLRAAGADISADFNRAVVEIPHLTDTSRYWRQLARYRELFPPEQIAVFFFEDFQKNPLAVLHHCQRFLEIEEMVPPSAASSHGHRTDEKLREHPMVRAVRRSPLLTSVLRRVPRSIREPLRQRTGERMDVKPTWGPDLKARVTDALRDDARSVCTAYGKPADFWNL